MRDVAWVASAAFGGAYIALTGLLLVWATRLHPSAPAAGVGLVFLLVAVGQSVGSPLLGFAWDAYGPRQAFLAAAVLAAVGAWARPVRESASSSGATPDESPLTSGVVDARRG